MKRTVVLIIAIVTRCFTGASIGAQESDTTRLETVVVSASKTPRPASALSQPVTVISGQDLRERGVVRVSDALREVPGVSMVQNGSFGAVTSMFLRGGESRYTKVLIDGVPVNAPGGFFDFSHLTTDNIERIEIVRGPSSVLHGADAVTGTVQIFTRKGTGPARFSVAARGGTHSSYDVSADAGGGNERGAFSFGAASHSTDGILPFNNQYENGTLSSLIRLSQGVKGDATVAARYTAAEFHYPTDFAGQPVDSNAYRVQHRLTVSLDAGRNFGSGAQARFLAGSNDVSDLTEDIAVPFGGTSPQHSAFRSRGYRRSAEGRVTFFIPAGATLTAGAAYEMEHETSSNVTGDVGGPSTPTDSFDASRRNGAYYSELLGNVANKLSYTLSARVDDNTDYDRFATYRVGANLTIVPRVRLRASLSTAFNAPAFNQLRPTLYTTGSPDLGPEKIRSGEIGFVATLSESLRLGGGYFNQRFAELIQYVSGGPPAFKGGYANLTGATSNGYEAELEIKPRSGWRGAASYTVVNPRVESVSAEYTGAERAGDALIRRPSHSGSVVAGYTASSGIGLSASVAFVGKRPDMDFVQFPSPRVTLASYSKTDLSIELPLAPPARGGLTLNARVENLFDKRYEDVLHFAAPGRVVFLGARALARF